MDLFDGSTSEEDDGDTVGEVVAELARLVPPVGAVKPVIVVAPDVDGAYEDRARGAGFDVASPGAACDALVVHALGDAVAARWRGGAAVVFGKRLCTADEVGCAPRPPASEAEHERAHGLAVAARRAAGPLPAAAFAARAARTLRSHGLVILPGLLDPAVADGLAADALADFEACRAALVEHRGVDLMDPGAPHVETYRELAMREDLRCDLRGTPRLKGEEGAERRHALRNNGALREICRLASEAPRTAARRGNFGLWNFDLGGPDAPKRALDAGPVGAVVSVPGAAEQALHADAPHLFDDRVLPPHYLNVFLYGGAAAADPAAGRRRSCRAGQESEIPNFKGSDFGHFPLVRARVPRPATCARLTDEAEPRTLAARPGRAVRPRLAAGTLIFARVLHFGLPNRSRRAVRAVPYANFTGSWFRDPKNWDDNGRVRTAPRRDCEASGRVRGDRGQDPDPGAGGERDVGMRRWTGTKACDVAVSGIQKLQQTGSCAGSSRA
ncbi:phytanoyl-CoA dioxygenase [Aureococcus anophagefferens]|nr:phytanoyl-CoA dioxygenase [Aureococcus anophagefferens]